MTASSSPFDGFVEFFTLARASAQLTRLGEPGRKQVASVLALGRQRAEAAETLWSNGHTAEALRLAFAGLDATLDAANALADGLKLDDAPAAAPKAAPVPAPKAEEPPKEEAPKTDDAPKAEGDAADAGDGEKKDAEATTSDGAETQADAAEKKPEDTAGRSPSDAVSIAESLRESEPSAPAPKPERWRAALAARSVGAGKLDRIAGTVVARRDAKLPELDTDVSPALADLFQRVMDARHAVDSAIGSGAWTAGEMRWARVRRWLGASLSVVAVVGGSYFGLHEPEGVFASASDVWQQSATFSADMAIDGRSDTWWLLPDRATGWVEERISPGRHVDEVVLVNAANPPAHDRGTQDYRLEIYSGGSVVQSIDGHFDWADDPQPVTHPIHLDDVDRVRFVVRTYHRTGGGLAEMTVR